MLMISQRDRIDSPKYSRRSRMIGSNRISDVRRLLLALICALFVSSASAQQEAAGTLRRASTPAVMKPASELVGQSLGLSASILALGAVLLVASRLYQGRLRNSRWPGQASPASTDRPQVTGRVRLTPRQSVHVLRIGNRVLVLGTGSQGSPELLSEWQADSDLHPPTIQELDDPVQIQALSIAPQSEAAA